MPVDSLSVRYDLSYNENIDSTIITAYFSLIPKRKQTQDGVDGCYGMSLTRLKTGSTISFNNIVLECNKYNYYENKIKGFIGGGSFILIDSNGNKMVSNVPTPEKIAFPKLHTLNKNFEISFPFEGTPLNKNEVVMFSFVDKEDHPVYVHSSIEGNRVRVPVNQTYADGPAVLRLERSYRSVSRNAQRIKFGEKVTYIAKDLPVEIVSQPGQTDPPRVRSGNNPQ
jgi:hypothetical protein